jgi:hypothetical protein
LTGAPATVAERPQVVDLPPVPAPVITEYQLLSKTCGCCGAVTTADWTGADDVNAQVVRQDDDRMQLELRVMLLFCGELFRQFSGLAAGTSLSGVRVELLAQARRDLAHNLSFAALAIEESAYAVTDWRPDSSRPTPPTTDGSGLGSDHLR